MQPFALNADVNRGIYGNCVDAKKKLVYNKHYSNQTLVRLSLLT